TAFACLKRCALFVGNDSGLMHLAAAAIPTVGLFGPSRVEHYAPWGTHTEVARTAIPFDDLFPADFDYRTTGTLMDSLSVDAAEAAARALWRRCGGARVLPGSKRWDGSPHEARRRNVLGLAGVGEPGCRRLCVRRCRRRR
ncbi:MAG: hypothetical protein IH827_08655, partial [Myxococcales bacterium]|nr:hypothetical protein [Myxococcales bacterium]